MIIWCRLLWYKSWVSIDFVGWSRTWFLIERAVWFVLSFIFLNSWQIEWISLSRFVISLLITFICANDIWLIFFQIGTIFKFISSSLFRVQFIMNSSPYHQLFVFWPQFQQKCVSFSDTFKLFTIPMICVNLSVCCLFLFCRKLLSLWIISQLRIQIGSVCGIS